MQIRYGQIITNKNIRRELPRKELFCTWIRKITLPLVLYW